MNSEALFEEKVAISPSDLSGRGAKGQKKEAIDIDSILLEKLASRLEGRCSIHGYVVPGSLTTLSRSMGYVENGRFTGDLVFHLQATGNVLYPPDGTVIEGRVEKTNAMGMFVVYEVKNKKGEDSQSFPAIKVILPRDLHLGTSKLAQEFSSCEPGDTVRLEIKKSRFQVNDDFILCVGLFRGLVQSAVRLVQEDKKDQETDENSEDDGENDGDAESKDEEEETKEE